jgi:hypothetical protein
MEQSLTTEDNVELLLMCGRPNYFQRVIADGFNNKHWDCKPVNQFTVSRLLQKFQQT